MRALASAVTVATASLVALPALAQPVREHWEWHGHSGFGVGHLLFWLVVIGGVVWLFRNRRLPWFNVPFGTQGALNVLRERYAKGEISSEEFDERRKKLAEQ